MKLREKIWLWGQSAGTHQLPLPDGEITFGLGDYPQSKMTPVEGLEFFGIENICRVVMSGYPAPPFDGAAAELRGHCRQAVWSVLGDMGTGARVDLTEMLQLRPGLPELVGGILDDFISMEGEPRLGVDEVRNIRDQLHAVGLDLRVVLYEPHLDARFLPWLDQFDVLTFWHWWGSHLTREQLTARYGKLFELAGGKPVMAGCYFWNYAEKRELTVAEMETQLDFFHELLLGNRIQGLIVCSNCIADLGLAAGARMKEWIAQHGEEFVP